MYELIIIWSTGDRNVYQFEDRERAEETEKGMRAAFGEQIAWTGINHITAWNGDTKAPTMYGM